MVQRDKREAISGSRGGSLAAMSRRVSNLDEAKADSGETVSMRKSGSNVRHVSMPD